MFVIESWPDTGKTGPRVVASADTRIVADVLTPFPDIVVWSRKVPETWPDLISQETQPSEPLTLSGPTEQLRTWLRDKDPFPKTLSFLRDDIEQTLSLTAALGAARTLRLTCHPVTTPFTPTLSAGSSPGSSLCAFCLYGKGTLTLFHEDGNQRSKALNPDPHALTFCRSALHTVPQPEFRTLNGSRCFALAIEAFTSETSSSY
ncbi:hypothetical protein GOB93_14580 [Acetobacter musti]|uniref:Uncharacterized protein n=1 Tax=Acetobacter musti TaxID=864732 RepID=A0ABX0JST7_9PROT|nr:hypothetical protein [Acetobacter musti]NHN85858.1 hypothetical protein [Acetobacter musti]